jgi:hypothetical protein
MRNTIRTSVTVLSVVLLGALLGGCHSTGGSQSDYYEDWWICVDVCAEEDADCVDACTDEFNDTHDDPGEDPPGLRLRRRTPGGSPGIPPVIVSRCPPGTVLSPFAMPIYDEDGLFIVGFKTVWYCLPEDLEPAG